MSGHSKWATIKRAKAAQDAKKGKIFTKVVKELTTAARIGGGDPAGNPRLRLAIDAAKAVSMPNDNITRAIKRGTGEIEGPPVEEAWYEGYAAGGVAVYVETQTDNKNRTSAEVRTVFNKNEGNLGAAGSVAWMFTKKAQFTFDAGKYTEDELMEVALEAGADDVKTEGGAIVVLAPPTSYGELATHFEKRSMKPSSAGFVMIPGNTVKVAGPSAAACLRLIEALEEIDDVQNVFANFDIDDSELERIAGAS